MGQAIVYCVQCATRIVGADFDRGKAFRADSKVYCAKCYAKLHPEGPPEQKQGHDSTKAPRPAAAPATSRLARPDAPPRSRAPLAVAGGIGAVVLLLGLVVALSRPEPRPTPVEPRPIAKTVPPAPVEDPELREARLAMEAAEAKAKAAPGDLDAQIAAWEEAAGKAALTPYYRKASAALKAAKDRRAASTPDVPKTVAPVVKPPEPVPPAVDPKIYLARWEPAMAKASARDFDGAIAELGRAAAEEARADVDDLQRARAMLVDVQSALSRLQRGQPVSLRCRTETGELRRVEGTVLRADAGRVEVRHDDGTIFVEAEDVAVASLAALLGNRTESERRTIAILCLLEGDRTGAEQLAAAEALPARYWDYGGAATAKAPKPAPREVEARTRFYAAEREFGRMETLAGAVATYRSLLKDYADTRVVKSESARLQKRSEAGRDYVFAGGMLKGTGTFALGPAQRVEVAWSSRSDVETASADNYVEAEFGALPDNAYRCWALVGGCCAETFTFHLQTTDGTDLDPKTKKKASIDPGGALAALVKHSITGLKKTHEEHRIKSAKTHPKTAARWEWVSIPLPKYAAAGAKKIRLISAQAGFAVGAVVVSATRTTPIPEAELKEEVAKARTRVVLEDGLVGWWRFEERSGTTAADAVDNAHPGQVKGATWGEGRVGGGLKCEGPSEVHIPGFTFTSPALTLSAWVKHDTLGGIQRYITVGPETAVIRHMGDQVLQFYITTDGQQRHLFLHNMLEAGKWIHVAGTWDGTTQKVYKNGVLVGSQTPGGQLTGPVSHAVISVAGEPLRGSIDEARIYTRALSDAEILKQYGEGP